MKKYITLFLISFFVFFSAFSQTYPTIFATVASGNWDATATWETFNGNATNTPGAQGTGTAASGTPSGTHFIYVRNGHTVSLNGASRAAFGINVENGGKLWVGSSSSFRLQLSTTNSSYPAPVTSSVTNNGTIGGATDGVYYELVGNIGTMTLSGSANAANNTIGRIRFPGNMANGNVSLVIDQDLNLSQAGNYALSLIYNPNPLDVYSLTINSGKTVTITNATGYLHNSSGTGFGKYTYNVNGTLDLTANTGASGTTLFQQLGTASSEANINVSGTLKLGSFTTSTNSNAAGTVNLIIKNGGTVEAKTAGPLSITPTIFFQVEGTGKFVRNVDATDVLFPVGVSTSYNPATINNAGTTDEFSVTVKNAIDNPLPGGVAQAVTKQWTINETVAGGTNATLKLGWVTADQGSSFNPASPVVIAYWNGSSWTSTSATVAGTGTATDPYIATASNFTSFTNTKYVVANLSAMPAILSSLKAYQTGTSIEINWATLSELNVNSFIIEKSINGSDFKQLTTQVAKGVASTYNVVDISPLLNSNNYYRLKILDKDGSIQYSKTVVVATGKIKTIDLMVSPNPIKGNTFSMQLSGFEKGNYSLNIFSMSGAKVYTYNIVAEENNTSQLITMPNTIAKGMYQLQITNGNTNVIKKIMIQ